MRRRPEDNPAWRALSEAQEAKERVPKPEQSAVEHYGVKSVKEIMQTALDNALERQPAIETGEHLPPIELAALRRRWCQHSQAADLDPLAIGTRRGLGCLLCGAILAHNGYERDERGVWRPAKGGRP
jgi:hypothetical protein